ncbi:hypothetical protein POM88_034656 [Heracleum sosnowskyi]|uniref:Kinesin motor domain-containing protein n=1 Tax=Heracleum sosnowskyi TaxID=360622 RepID=A0AAD8HJN2_9APIA|nr:hypothetical protein POM88_034649 [Heracleum sosnowskyi]KAK1368564.1 hypothetical protein POM88_034656 [Heracleum sosnowskyi]
MHTCLYGLESFTSNYKEKRDKVFGSDQCSTKQVYEEGLKNVALSVVTGINTSIFAYGQTSSGKTYTIRGISESSMSDIFDYICEHDEREFVLKFSAMEIYNESVRDLLGLDSTPLRLLDDPERGTVVDKLTETVESYPRKFASADDLSTLAASGIEKASKHVTHSPKSFRVLGSVGEPINPAWRWFYHVIGALRCPISDTWCPTETGSFMITSLSGVWPQNPGSATFPFSCVQVVLSCHWSLEVPNIRHLVPNRDRQLHDMFLVTICVVSDYFAIRGMRASNRQQSPTSVTSSNGPSKQKSDACGISVAYLTATTSLSKVSVLHSDSGKKLNGEIRLTAQMNKSEPVASVELYSDADQQRKPSNTSAMIGHSINQVISSQISHNPILQQKKHPPVRILLLQEIGLNSD